MKQQTLLGELFFPGNWWRCRRPTLCEKVVGITDQLLTTDLRMCLCKMRMAPVKAWEFHHSYNHIYIDIYIYIYIYIHSCNPAKSSTKLHILIDLGVLWYVVMRPFQPRMSWVICRIWGISHGLLDALSVSQTNRRSSCTIRSSTSAWVAGRGAGHP
jgi:hypothetical protein